MVESVASLNLSLCAATFGDISDIIRQEFLFVCLVDFLSLFCFFETGSFYGSLEVLFLKSGLLRSFSSFRQIIILEGSTTIVAQVKGHSVFYVCDHLSDIWICCLE